MAKVGEIEVPKAAISTISLEEFGETCGRGWVNALKAELGLKEDSRKTREEWQAALDALKARPAKTL